MLVHWAGGARVNAVATGLSAKQEANRAADRKALLPPAPRAEAYRVAATVTGEPTLGTMRLIGHPPAALRRRLVWALTPAVTVVASLAALGAIIGWKVTQSWIQRAGVTNVAATTAAGKGPTRSATPRRGAFEERPKEFGDGLVGEGEDPPGTVTSSMPGIKPSVWKAGVQVSI